MTPQQVKSSRRTAKRGGRIGEPLAVGARGQHRCLGVKGDVKMADLFENRTTSSLSRPGASSSRNCRVTHTHTRREHTHAECQTRERQLSIPIRKRRLLFSIKLVRVPMPVGPYLEYDELTRTCTIASIQTRKNCGPGSNFEQWMIRLLQSL